MTEARATSICIVGAGATGLVTGYLLSLAGAAVTFLVRPHRLEQLSHPQMLYSYDDDTLTAYSDYEVMSDPTELVGSSFDFVLVTLDGTALRAESGLELVDAIGRAFRDTSTAIILASVGIGLRTWFIERAGLEATQVMNGQLDSFAYAVPSAIVPNHPDVTPALHAKASLAYRHPRPHGFSVDQNAPEAAHAFAALYDRNGSRTCRVVPADEFQVRLAAFTTLMTLHLLSWPPVATIDGQDETWRLGFDALREVQRLSIFGPAGLKASEQASPESALQRYRELEQATLPLEFSVFNAYHHGGKVNVQDRAILLEALSLGEAEGAEMPALRALIERLSKA